jgi:hypothetical protein
MEHTEENKLNSENIWKTTYFFPLFPYHFTILFCIFQMFSLFNLLSSVCSISFFTIQLAFLPYFPCFHYSTYFSPSWIVKKIWNIQKKVSWIVKTFEKYRTKLWNDMEIMEKRKFLPFFHIVHILSLFNLPFFRIVHILSLFKLHFFHMNSDKIWTIRKKGKLNYKKIWNIQKKISWIVKTFGKYRAKLWNDMEIMEEK